MKLLTFSPRATIYDPRIVVERILAQEKVEFFDVLFTYDNPHGSTWFGSYKNIQMNYEKMRQTALQGGYDKVWVVESDTIPPTDALSMLLEVEAPIVSGLYALRHGTPYPNLMRMGKTPNVGGAMAWKDIQDHWGETIEVSGGCMGCLLIDKNVLLDFSFNTGTDQAPDGPFMEHCYQNKVKQMARLDVICGHVKPNGEVLWPDKDQGYRIEGAN